MDSLKEEKINTTIKDNMGGLDSRFKRKVFILNLILVISVFILLYFYLFSSPLSNKDVTLHFGTDDSLSKISTELKARNVIRNSFLLKTFLYTLSFDKHIQSGDYLFKRNKNLFSITLQILRGVHNVEKIKVTLREGITNNEFANILADKIPSFRKDLFLADKRSKEGYLFPDTYFFYPLSTTDEILNELTLNFNNKINSVRSEIDKSGKSIKDIIIMASILEKEAAGKEDIYIISGILWKRIKLNMPLQVDAYVKTYKEAGLPNEPICNPGLVAINAAINPTQSSYLFYLHDDNGRVHYAIDFSEHRSNIARYLK